MKHYIPGTYEGVAKGYNGNLKVQVIVTEDRITDVEVTEHREVRGIAWGLHTTPIEVIPPRITASQSLNIPAVTGADVTSAAILEAVEAALRAAGAADAQIEALKAVPGPVTPAVKDETRTVDVLVVGAGAAGLAAAIEAKNICDSVVVIEKQGITGGSTTRSAGKLLGAGSRWQKAQGIFDTPEMTYDYLMEVGNRLGDFMNPTKTRYLADHLNETIEWLCTMGYTVQDIEPTHESMQPWRVHNSIGGEGANQGAGGEIMVPLTSRFEDEQKGEILYNTALKDLLTDESGAVTGAMCERADGSKLTVYARRGVILTTGGYSRNKEMVSRYAVAHYFGNSPKGNVGDGLVAAEKIGARNYVHPGIQCVCSSFTCGVGVNEEAGLIVGADGRRLINEWTYRYDVGGAIANSGSNYGWYITSGNDPYPSVQKGFRDAVEGKSRDKAADSIEELAVLMKCDPKVLRETYDRYCELGKLGRDEDFGKPVRYFFPIEGPKYVAIKLHPCVSVSFGGLDTDISARVLGDDGRVIPNLYAAGEVAGTGLYGIQYPSCGTSIGAALFYGRIAGRVATGQSML